MKPRAFECVECHKQFKSESSKEQHCKDKHHPPQQLNTDVFPCGRCSLKCSTVMELALHSSTHVQTPTQHPYESVSNPYPPEIARRLEVLGIGRTYPFAQTTPEPPSWLIDACTQGRLPPRWVKTEAENYTPNSHLRANAGSLDVKGKGVDASRMKEKHRADKGRADTASTSHMSNTPLISSAMSFAENTFKGHNTEPCPNDATSAQPTAIPRPAGMDKDTEVQCSQGFGKFRNAAALHDHCKAKECQTEAASDFPPLPSKPAGLDSSVAHKPTVLMSNGSGIQCTICLVWVVDKADLDRHWQERHAIKCRDCQTDFDTDRALEIHIRDTPNHICCSICNKTYRLKATLHYHISVNHVGQRPPAECLICNKGYKSVGVLEDHIAAIHRLDTRHTLQTIDGVAQYGTFPSSLASMPEPPVKPGRKEDDAEIADSFASAHAADVLESAAVSTTQSATIAGAEDDGLPTSGSTSGKNISPTVNLQAAPGRRERASSLVASDSGSWSEVDDVSDVDALSDLFSADSDCGEQGGPAAMSDSQHASGAEIRTEIIEDRHSSALSAVTSDEPDIPSVLKEEKPKDDKEPEPKAQVYTLPGAVPQEKQASVHPDSIAWACKVCNSMPTSPMITMCGHIFCRGCIVAEISTNFCCPTCKYPILVEVKL